MMRHSGCANSPTVFLPASGPAPAREELPPPELGANDAENLSRGFAHCSILLSRSSRSSNRALPESGHLVCPVGQRGQRAKLRAIVRLAPFATVAHPSGLRDNG